MSFSVALLINAYSLIYSVRKPNFEPVFHTTWQKKIATSKSQNIIKTYVLHLSTSE